MTYDPTQPMTFEQQREYYISLPAEKKAPAVALLREKISDADKQKIRDAIEKDGRGWITPHHFWFGMAIRNILRDEGFGEGYWPIWNMDDIYVYLIEEAVQE